MTSYNHVFDEHRVLHKLKHYLPAQASLKDFIHHNTLHAFQDEKFYDGINRASQLFGYRVNLSLQEYRDLFKNGKINIEAFKKAINERNKKEGFHHWKENLLYKSYDENLKPRIGGLRSNWKTQYRIDMDSLVHPVLFRILCSYLDQGIAIWKFPALHKGFLSSLKELERNSFASLFKTDRAKQFLIDEKWELKRLLSTLVGDESLYEQYLFDQQFAHQGWSGFVSAVEDHHETLSDYRKISLHDLLFFELLLEIDAMDFQFGDEWIPLALRLKEKPPGLFDPVREDELSEVKSIWQNAFEWSYYDLVLNGLSKAYKADAPGNKSFQAMFCIDDRSCSLRRYLEHEDPCCETFGTPGFFNVEFYYKPEHGKFYTKLCPAPVTPKYLIRETGSDNRPKKDLHFSKHSHKLFRGWLISQPLGFWSAIKLFLNVFNPSPGAASTTAFRHNDKFSTLTVEYSGHHSENNLQVGFTVEEMAHRVEGLLKSIGLVKDFANIIYVIGHGSSSINNPHYSAYDCGACSGRPGSVNARVICVMANDPRVREILSQRGVNIPANSQFLAGIHDTSRDEVLFYEEGVLHESNTNEHTKYKLIFEKALVKNSKERSRRFDSVEAKISAEEAHEKVRLRSDSLFEPRPELNHATNSLCIVGRRVITKHLFLDRRAFLNSYDYRIDPEGKYLFNILKAAAPVCGGINLEYFFSRTDNEKLGAGSKLPHNVMGLFAVANGADGDLRPGLPSQMIEVHDPIRLLIIVEQYPDIILDVIQRSPETYEWFKNEWVHLVAIHPETRNLCRFVNEKWIDYKVSGYPVDIVRNVEELTETSGDNLPVYLLRD
jgi:uncharacterized protein